MAIAMSSSRADPVLGLYIPLSCPGWGYLNIKKKFLLSKAQKWESKHGALILKSDLR